jgi:flagellum-specific peptidoglycan hydrolase FlgJ
MSFNDFSIISGNLKSFGVEKIYPKSKLLTDENLHMELDQNHIICPEQVYAQIVIESGHFNSYLTKKTNNILGMRYPFKRSSTAIGIYLPASNQIIKGKKEDLKKYRKQNNYAVYNSWEDCVKDYKYWQENTFNLTERYLNFLGNCYAEDSLYISKIKNIAR